MMAYSILPWQGWLLLMILVAILIQRATQIYFHSEWLRFASDKARDIVHQTRAECSALRAECNALRAENAELRGRLQAIKIELEQPHQLELVYDSQSAIKRARS